MKVIISKELRAEQYREIGKKILSPENLPIGYLSMYIKDCEAWIKMNGGSDKNPEMVKYTENIKYQSEQFKKKIWDGTWRDNLK